MREVAREIEHYNLDAILAVGYRVSSPRSTQFRRWATERGQETRAQRGPNDRNLVSRDSPDDLVHRETTLRHPAVARGGTGSLPGRRWLSISEA
jgi:hypothetical protein